MTLSKKSIVLFYTITSIVCSCQGISKKSNALVLHPSEEVLILPIDQNTPNISMGLVYKDGNLINVNWKTNSLHFFDLTSNTKDKEILFDQEGPNGVGSIFGIYVHTLDSIFLFTQMTSVIVLTDTTGKI